MRIDSGTLIGRYTVERRLTQGATSVLWLAHDKCGDEVALTIIEEPTASLLGRGRVLRESKTAALLDSPGIGHIYGAGEYESGLWMAAEYIRGTDLRWLLSERGALPPRRALQIIAQATDALSVAHEAGIVHGDLKPSHLIVTYDHRVKLVSFGLGQRKADNLRADGGVVRREFLGSAPYFSPEQVEHRLADHQSDLWAMGCILFELCVGRAPFGNNEAALAAIVRDELEIPLVLRGNGVLPVIQACLRKSTFDRIGSARELASLARETARIMGTSGVSVRPPDPSRRTPSRPPATAAPAPDTRKPTTARPSVTTRAASAEGSRTWPAAPPRETPSVAPGLGAFGRGRLKGTALRAAIAWFATTYGDRAVDKLHAMASPPLRAVLRIGEPAFGIMAGSWYDVALVGELLDLIDRVALPADPSELRMQMAIAVARDHAQGVYRSLFRTIMTPELIEANAQRVWATYFDGANLSARIVEHGEIRIELVRWMAHDPRVCAAAASAIDAVLKAVGYEGVQVERAQCIASGASCCAFDAFYTP